MRKMLLPALVCIAVLLAAALPGAGYNDHRGHNLDSLERAVARWTPDALDRASTEDLIELNRAYRDLMLGYNVLNGEKCIFYAHRALAISHPRGWSSADADAYRYLGQQFYGREQYDSAMVYYRASLAAVEQMAAGAVSPTNPEGYDELEIDDALSSLYGSIGNLYNVMDSIPQAMSYYEKAGAIFEQYGWNESSSVLYYNIGETWMDEGDYRQAARAYDAASRYAHASGDSLMIADVYKGLGRLYMETDRIWKALPYLREAEAYYALHPDDSPGFRTENLEYMGAVLARQKRQMAWMIVGGVLLVLLAAAVWVVLRRLRRAHREQTEVAAVMDETLEELRTAAGGDSIPDLSGREKEVLDLVAKGYTTRQIADAIHLSYETIRWYRKKLLVKFDVSNTAELVSIAKERSLL